MKRLASLATAAVLFTTVGPLSAHAELLNFNLSGSRDAVFQLDSNPTPDTSSSSFIGDQFAFTAISGIFGGVAGVADISFADGPILADFNILSPSLGFTQFAGPALFSGSATSPMFSAGTFELTSIVSGNSTLVISEASAAPEPGVWALMIAGVAMIGSMFRFGRRSESKTTRAA